MEATEWHAEGEIDGEGLRRAGNEAYQAWEAAAAVPDDPGEPPDKVLYGSSRLWRHRPYEDDPVARRHLAPHRGIALFHAAYAAAMLAFSATERVLAEAQEAVWFGTAGGQRPAVAAEVLAEADLLRDLFGPLLFRPVRIEPAWLTWNSGTLRRLAEAIYNERSLPEGHLDTGKLAVLADAFEDAGCDNADLLNHCRSEGPHVRGCWVVDLLLGKE